MKCKDIADKDVLSWFALPNCVKCDATERLLYVTEIEGLAVCICVPCCAKLLSQKDYHGHS